MARNGLALEDTAERAGVARASRLVAHAQARLADERKGAELARATWDLEQRRRSATAAARVFDTPFRAGEWVPASTPVYDGLLCIGPPARQLELLTLDGAGPR